MNNILLAQDSYKHSKYLEYPSDLKFASYYLESRGGDYDFNLFFGLQIFLKEVLSKRLTLKHVNEAEEIVTSHGLPFNREGFMKIVNDHDGYMPLLIQAVPEGTVLPIKNALIQVMNTDPELPWLPSFLETSLLRAGWYGTTVATRSKYIKTIIQEYSNRTSDTNENDFKLHDFGYRGVSSTESGNIGAVAHLINFRGTDTLGGLVTARKFYGETTAGYSIPALEHSSVISWGRENEYSSYKNAFDQYSKPNAMFALPPDAYNIWDVIDNLFGGELKDRIINSGGKFVVRSDSGNPIKTPVKVIEKLMGIFGYTVNSKGYKVLPPYIGVLQGDGINENSIEDILDMMEFKKLSSDNIGFGMGGELLQTVNRDTLKMAFKPSAVKADGMWQDVYKSPVDDEGKTSKKGRLAVVKNSQGILTTIREDQVTYNQQNYLEQVFYNGKLLRNQTFKEIRSLSDG